VLGYFFVRHPVILQKDTLPAADDLQTSALFGDFTQRRMALPYRRSGTAYRSRDCSSLEAETEMSQNVDMELQFFAA
jgi:hypothetical protein